MKHRPLAIGPLSPRSFAPTELFQLLRVNPEFKLAFGDHARKLVVNSTKSMTGHLLGGAGGVETVFAALAVDHQVSPPTTNIFAQDPACDLDYCANQAREMRIDVAMKNNFGFGGTNGTLIFRRA